MNLYRSQMVKGQGHQAGIFLRPEMRHIFRKRRPTNFKLGIQTQHEDPHQRQAPWPSRSKVKVARSRDASDRCWPISRERNVLGRAIRNTIFKVKCQGSRSLGRLTVTQKVCHIFWMKRPTNLKLDTQLKHEEPQHGQCHDLQSQGSW